MSLFFFVLFLQFSVLKRRKLQGVFDEIQNVFVKNIHVNKKSCNKICLSVCLFAIVSFFFFPIISLGEFLFVCLFVSYCKVQVQRTRLKFWIPDKICPSNRYKNNEFSCKQSKSDQESLRRNKYGTLQSHLYSQFSFVQPSFKKSLGK